MTPGEKIKKRRLELNIQVEELAEAIGKSRATVYRYENGFIDDIPINILKKIADVLQTSPTYLMGISESKGDNLPDPTHTPKTKQARILAGIADIMPENERDFLLGWVEHMYVKYAAEYERMEKKHEGPEP